MTYYTIKQKINNYAPNIITFRKSFVKLLLDSHPFSSDIFIYNFLKNFNEQSEKYIISIPQIEEINQHWINDTRNQYKLNDTQNYIFNWFKNGLFDDQFKQMLETPIKLLSLLDYFSNSLIVNYNENKNLKKLSELFDNQTIHLLEKNNAKNLIHISFTENFCNYLLKLNPLTPKIFYMNLLSSLNNLRPGVYTVKKEQFDLFSNHSDNFNKFTNEEYILMNWFTNGIRTNDLNLYLIPHVIDSFNENLLSFKNLKSTNKKIKA